MNVEVRELEDAIIGLLNGSDVMIEVKRLIIKDVLTLVEKSADQAIRAELEERNAEIVHEN